MRLANTLAAGAVSSCSHTSSKASASGFSRARFSRARDPQPWWMTVASHFKWMGPLLIAIAVVLAIAEPA
jgi:hypothetical protein